jgi:hypothetical protein
LLRRLGPVWLAAPVRRIVQSICFLAFLWLFFVTCWPYSATPSRSWNGWIPADFDFEVNSVLLVSDENTDTDAAFINGQRVFVRDESAGLTDDPLTAPFEVVLAADGELRLRLERTSNFQHRRCGGGRSKFDVESSMFEELSLSPGPWSIHESDPAGWPSHYADNLSRKENIAAELFLVIDPLVSLSTGIAARAWVWSLSCAGIILAACVFVPRGFCGYLCPLGTLIDLSDWACHTVPRVRRRLVGSH